MSDMGATARESSSQHNRFQYTTTRGISDSNRKVNTRRVLLLHRKQHLQLASRLGRGMVNFCLAGLLLCLALLLPWVNASQVDTRTVIPTTHATRTQTSLQTDEDHELHENARAERHNGASVNTSLRQIIKANDKTHSTRPRRRRLQGRVPGLGRRGSKSDGEGAGAGEAQPGFEGQREAGGGNTPVEGEDTGVEKLHDQDLSDPEQDEGEKMDLDDSIKPSGASGISKNVLVIVFCVLAFVANGGFLVYVFWVM